MTARGVHAVIVTYNPPPDIDAVLERCAKQVITMHVIDNASAQPFGGAARFQNAVATHNSENLGLAAALNQGVEAALRAGAEWVLTMDQDTLLPDDAVGAMLAAVDSCTAAETVGIAAPRHAIRGKPSRGVATNRGCAERETVMMSANLVRRTAFERAGLFDASFFIDYVDFEFCLRVRRARLRVVEVPQVVVDHRLGAIRERRLFGMRVRHTHHDPNRRYFKARNRVRTYRRHFTAAPLWVLKDIWRIPWELASAAILEQDPAASVRAMMKGLRDGVRSSVPYERGR